MVSFAISLAVYLYVLMGIGGCLWPSAYIVMHMTSPSHVLSNKPPNYSYDSEDITFFIIP